jgi:hypothetical protein
VNLSLRKENLHEAGMQFNMKRHATTKKRFMKGNLRPCLKQMLPRPGIDLLQERLDSLPNWSERIFDPHGHFWEHFPSDKTIPSIVLDREFLPASTKLCSAAHHPKTQPESC